MAVFLACALCSCDRSETDGGREVVVYCSADQGFAEPILAEFEKATGIKVRARYDVEAAKTVGLVNRIRAEAGGAGADVFWSSEVFYTIQLANEGLLAPYDSAATKTWPETFTDPERRWRGLAVRARVICPMTCGESATTACLSVPPRRLSTCR